MPLPSRTITFSIDRALSDVYAFASHPENFPLWASGLCQSIAHVDGKWLAQTPLGPLEVTFSAQNPFGILDHWVHVKDAPAVYVPMRLIQNDDGTEVVFTLFQMPDMNAEKFASDAAWVEKDLLALKRVLEEQTSAS